MPRLDTEKQNRLEPKRIAFAKKELEEMGFEVTQIGKRLHFEFKGYTVFFWPYSGWHSGKSIQDGRGWKKLQEQLK